MSQTQNDLKNGVDYERSMNIYAGRISKNCFANSPVLLLLDRYGKVCLSAFRRRINVARQICCDIICRILIRREKKHTHTHHFLIIHISVLVPSFAYLERTEKTTKKKSHLSMESIDFNVTHINNIIENYTVRKVNAMY